VPGQLTGPAVIVQVQELQVAPQDLGPAEVVRHPVQRAGAGVLLLLSVGAGQVPGEEPALDDVADPRLQVECRQEQRRPLAPDQVLAGLLAVQLRPP
jgi:hypothetical protein